MPLRRSLPLGRYLQVAALFAVSSCASVNRQEPGLLNARLQPCEHGQNCVCSEDQEGPGAIEPLVFEGPPEEAWERVQTAVADLGGKIQRREARYLWATFRSALFRFVDDLELRLDPGRKVIHVRSASRLGRLDFGKNRKRVEALRRRFKELAKPPSPVR